MKLCQSTRNWIDRHSWLTAGIVLFLLAGIAYLPQINRLGIYRDDWHIIFGGQTYGPGIFVQMFSIDRPFLGWNFLLFYKILGGSIISWNLFAFGLRVAGGLFFLAIIHRLWPKQALAGLLMGAMFIVYPGFLQQSNAITYSAHLTYTLMLIFSLFMTVAAFQSTTFIRRILFTVLALGSMAYYFLLYEYVIGIEGLRVALLTYLVFRESRENRFWKKVTSVLKSWWPYLLLAAGLLSWRLFFFHATRPTTNVGLLVDQYRANPLYQLGTVGLRTLQDGWEIAFSAWFVPFYNLASLVRVKQQVFALALGAAAAAVLAYFLFAGRKEAPQVENEISNDPWAKHAVWIGAFGLLISILPVVASGRDVAFGSILTVAFDRYTLHSTPAAVILIGGLLFTGIRASWRRILPVVLVGLAVATQLNAGSIFADAWKATQDFWWQMSWRAPQLQPGTMLLAGFGQNQNVVLEEYQVGYPANLIYYPGQMTPTISSAPLLTVIGEKVVRGVQDSTERRTITINNDYRSTLIAYFPTATSCLHVLDGRLPVDSTGTTPIVEWLAPYSKISQINVTDQTHTPPVEVFGAEPARGWCYDYQRASLAFQTGDWALVDQISRDVNQQGLKPNDLSERLPFLFAHANSGNYDAAKVDISLVKDQSFIRSQVCTHLDENPDSPWIATPEARIFILQELCTG